MQTKRHRQAFALVAALGVLAVLMLLVFAAAGAVQSSVSDLGRARAFQAAQVLIDVTLEKTLRQGPPLGNLQEPVTLEWGTCTALVHPCEAEDEIYHESGLTHAAGDCRVSLNAQLSGQLPRLLQVYLVNPSARPASRILLTERRY